MSDDPNRPAEHNWEGEEMRPDAGRDNDAPPAEDDPEFANWNERQMAEQRKDGSRSPGPTDEEIAEESEGGLSGGGVNPGGGERWAERDEKKE